MSGRQDLVSGFNSLVRIHSADLSSSGEDQSGGYLDAQHPQQLSASNRVSSTLPRLLGHHQVGAVISWLSGYRVAMTISSQSSQVPVGELELCYEAN
jgi:hypothetical protein